MCRIIRHERPCSARMAELASVAQGIEHRSPKAGVAGSNPAGGATEAKRCPAKSSGTAFFVGKRAAASRPPADSGSGAAISAARRCYLTRAASRVPLFSCVPAIRCRTYPLSRPCWSCHDSNGNRFLHVTNTNVACCGSTGNHTPSTPLGSGMCHQISTAMRHRARPRRRPARPPT